MSFGAALSSYDSEDRHYVLTKTKGVMLLLIQTNSIR